MNVYSDREKGILSGLFLSKFDKEGLKNLGFSSFKEAFNIIGISLGISPNSIKNYRDEFAPKFSNSRQGWHMREMTNPSKLIFEKFKNFELEDTTKLGCGFDFRLHKENEFICVEVKGLNGSTGGVSLTDKEYRVADFLTDKYFLFVVKYFKSIPFHSYYKNPLSQLTFKKIEQQIVQTTWNANALL